MKLRSGIASQIIYTALNTIPEPPVDLFQIAETIGVSSVRATDFRNGYTDFTPRRPVIFLNRVESGSRMQFILAHEIAHVMLRMTGPRSVLEVTGQTILLKDEEKLADHIGATLLLPDSWINALREVRYTLTGLDNLAQLADVPLMVLIDRMSSFHIDVAILNWWSRKHSWHLVDRRGVPPLLHGYFELSQDSHYKLGRLNDKESLVSVDGFVDERFISVTGPAYRRGKEVFQLIEPS